MSYTLKDFEGIISAFDDKVKEKYGIKSLQYRRLQKEWAMHFPNMDGKNVISDMPLTDLLRSVPYRMLFMLTRPNEFFPYYTDDECLHVRGTQKESMTAIHVAAIEASKANDRFWRRMSRQGLLTGDNEAKTEQDEHKQLRFKADVHNALNVAEKLYNEVKDYPRLRISDRLFNARKQRDDHKGNLMIMDLRIRREQLAEELTQQIEEKTQGCLLSDPELFIKGGSAITEATRNNPLYLTYMAAYVALLESSYNQFITPSYLMNVVLEQDRISGELRTQILKGVAKSMSGERKQQYVKQRIDEICSVILSPDKADQLNFSSGEAYQTDGYAYLNYIALPSGFVETAMLQEKHISTSGQRINQQIFGSCVDIEMEKIIRKGYLDDTFKLATWLDFNEQRLQQCLARGSYNRSISSALHTFEEMQMICAQTQCAAVKISP